MKVYMVAPWEQYYGYDMACARFFSTKEEADRYCEKRQEKDSSWEVEEYDVDSELVDKRTLWPYNSKHSN